MPNSVTVMTEFTHEIEESATQLVYAVVAQGRLGIDRDVLAIYSTRERAQELIDAQNQELQSCLVIWDIKVDEHPSDEFWAKPKGMAGAFQALAGLQDDADPR